MLPQTHSSDIFKVNKTRNFRKYNSSVVDAFNIPYDYESIMHYNYSSNEFAKKTLKRLYRTSSSTSPDFYSMECVPCTYAEHIIRSQIFSDESTVGMIYHGHQLQHLETEREKIFNNFQIFYLSILNTTNKLITAKQCIINKNLIIFFSRTE